MPYLATRRLYNTFGKKVSRYFGYKKAKRMFNMITRDVSFLEARFLRSRMNQM